MNRSRLISLVAASAAAVVIVGAVVALRGRDTMMIPGPVYTCMNGMKIEWDEVRLSHKGEETFLHEGKIKNQLEMYPLIAANQQETQEKSEWDVPTSADGSDERIILQKTSSWNRTEDDRIYRVDYYTEISKKESELVFTRRGKEARASSGFVYDNEDTYIFLEPVLLTWGDQVMNLEPMTIVQVSYMDYLQIFGPGVEPVFENYDGDKVTAEFSNGKSINLAVDRYYTGKGAWRLLFLPVELLSGIE